MYDDEHYENTCFAKLISDKKILKVIIMVY